MKLQQKGNSDNHVVFNFNHGDAVCMSNNKGRGIDEFADGVQLEHGCPKALMKSAGSEVSITIVVDVSFDNKTVKLEALGLLCTNSNSI